MCDCYMTPCEGCEAPVSVHIGGFSVAGKNVHPYCPECHAKAIDRLAECGEPYIVFADDSPIHEVTLFLVDMPRNVHIN